MRTLAFETLSTSRVLGIAGVDVGGGQGKVGEGGFRDMIGAGKI